MYPPARYRAKTSYEQNYMSQLVPLLPFLQKDLVYSSINFDLHRIENPGNPLRENSTVRIVTLSEFLCPSDPEPKHRNSYRFNTGKITGKNSSDGVFSSYSNSYPRAASITDGLSSTAFMSEGVGGSYNQTNPNFLMDMKLPQNYPSRYLPDNETYLRFCESSPPKAWEVHGGRHWYFRGVNWTAYNHSGPPNQGTTCGGDSFGLLPARSHHPSIVNVLFGDASVHTIRNSVSKQVWMAVGTGASGDIVQTGDF
jgi:hypothetical protein